MSSDEPLAGLTLAERLQVTHAMLWIALRRLGYSDDDILKLEQQALALTDQTQAIIRDRRAGTALDSPPGDRDNA